MLNNLRQPIVHEHPGHGGSTGEFLRPGSIEPTARAEVHGEGSGPCTLALRFLPDCDVLLAGLKDRIRARNNLVHEVFLCSNFEGR